MKLIQVKNNFIKAATVTVLALTAPESGEQPLLLVGEGKAELSGGFSYDFLESPLRKNFQQSVGKLRFNLPVNISWPLHKTLEEVTGDFLVVPQFEARVRQHFNTGISVCVPVLNGVGHFAFREIARLDLFGALGNANLDIDTLGGSEAGKIMLKGSINVPLQFNLYWRAITFGYTVRPSRYVKIAFQVHKHIFGAAAGGNLRTALTGRIHQATEQNILSIDVIYPEDKVYGNVSGHYKGEAWVPEMGVQIGPVGLVSRMGLDIEMKGNLKSEYSVPFFIDESNFLPKFTEADSFLSAENLPRLLNGEVTANGYNITDNFHLRVPHSHTVSVDFIPDRIFLSYSKTFGKLESYTMRDSTGDTTYLATGNVLDASLMMDHMLILTTHFGAFRQNLGFCHFDVAYRNRKGLYSGLMRNALNSGPYMPIWNFGLCFGKRNVFDFRLFIAPFPAVRTGFHYVF